MAQTLEQAQQQRELTKDSLARNLELFETQVREQLDWKTRLQRDGARYAVFGVIAVAGLAGVWALRKAVSRSRDDDAAPTVTSLEDLVAELASLRAAIEKSGRGGKDGGATWQKLLFKGLSAVASAGAAAAFRQFMERQENGDYPDPVRSGTNS